MRGDNLNDEDNVLRSLAGGSEQAFKLVFDHYRAKVYRLALKFLKSSELAEEVVQEVFLKIWLKRAELGEIRSFDSYLFIATKNTTLDALKKLAARAAAEGDFAAKRYGVDDSIDHSMLEEQYLEMVRKSVALLPAQQARVFQMAKIDGLSHEAIAAEMNISRLTVKKHMANALQFIRLRLDRHLITTLPLLLSAFVL
jgi:RNA polymerase sigma-70 factor (family 1)